MHRTLQGIAIGALLIVIFIGAVGFFAPTASAQTVSGIQAQIQELLSRIVELTRQLNSLQGEALRGPSLTPASIVPVTIAPSKHRVCLALGRNLATGTSGDDVQSLQEFLREQGHFSAEATGYFGPITRAALARWQAAQGVDSVGVLGPITRERIKHWCAAGGGSDNTERFSAEPQRGVAPLTVVFKTNARLSNPNFVADAGSYKIVFGDGTEHVFSCSNSTGFCPGPHSARHTYAVDGTYTARLVHYGYYGIPGPNGFPESTVGTVTIYVGGQDVVCTREYRPVCGQKQLRCITTQCNPVQQTYSNRCMMEADGAAFLHEGQCRTDVADPSADPRCRSWYDGCNSCSRATPGDPGGCTLRYCFQQEPAYCSAYFDDTSANKPPAISGLSGPTMLVVNQTGTWTVRASDPENGQLSYSVAWGDEGTFLPFALSATRDAFVQTSTFTHAYARVGTYTVTVTVRDSAGQTAQTSSTVRVGTNFSQPVACADAAKQCPDGSWVGRTGPNCEFVCPTY